MLEDIECESGTKWFYKMSWNIKILFSTPTKMVATKKGLKATLKCNVFRYVLGVVVGGSWGSVTSNNLQFIFKIFIQNIYSMYMNSPIQISKLKLNNTDNFIIKVHEFLPSSLHCFLWAVTPTSYNRSVVCFVNVVTESKILVWS